MKTLYDIEILQVDVPTITGRIYPRHAVVAAIGAATYPIPGMIGMPSTTAELYNINPSKQTHETIGLYIVGNTMFGTIHVTDPALEKYIDETSGTALEPLFRTAALTSGTTNSNGNIVCAHVEILQINALPGERLLIED